MIDSTENGPINLGTQFELSVLELASFVLKVTGSNSVLEYHPLPTDDPTRRRPVLTRAEVRLGWRPQISIEVGLRRMVEWFQKCREEVAAAKLTISGGPLEKISRTLVSAGVNSADGYASTEFSESLAASSTSAAVGLATADADAVRAREYRPREASTSH